jgi:mannose/fructose/N-acetylgalactosamine-specific phosphotransferase system component IID
MRASVMAGLGVKLRRFVLLLGMSARALFLLNLWNDRTLQGAGFAWTMDLVRGPGDTRRLAGDATGFNTTPAMAPCVIGAMARMEIEGATPGDLHRVRDSGASSVSAVGDQLFWGSVRPSSALAGLLMIPLGPWVAAVGLVAAQALPQVVFRAIGMVKGFAKGKGAIQECIEAARRALGYWRVAGSVLVGALGGAVLAGMNRDYGAYGAAAAPVAVVVMGWLMSSMGVRPSRICIALLASSGILSRIVGS